MPTAGFSDENHMNQFIGFLVAASMFVPFASGVAQAKPLESRPAAIEKPCLEQGDANRCFELGYKFLNAKGKNSKRLARYYFRVGCAAKMQKSNCSAEEAKYAARDFTQTNRSIASQKGAVKASAKK